MTGNNETGNNELTDSIPTEIGLLTKLTELDLSKHLFSILLYALKKDEYV